MKKLICAVLCGCLFSVGTAFAETEDGNFSDALIIERAFVLVALTSNGRGEWEIGKRNNWLKDTSFCIPQSDGKTSEEALGIASKLASDYNQFSTEKNKISVSTDCNGNGQTLFRFIGSFPGGSKAWSRWKCDRGEGGKYSECVLTFSSYAKKRFGRNVAHQMLNMLGYQDTDNQLFKECVIYDNQKLRNISSDYKGLCDIEKRLINFKTNIVSNGDRVPQIIAKFSEHWKPSEQTKVISEEIAKVKADSKSGEHQWKEFCSLMFGSSYCDGGIQNSFCNKEIYGDASFCQAK